MTGSDVELDLDLPLGAELLDELHASTQARALGWAVGGVADVLGPHSHGDIGTGVGGEAPARPSVVGTGTR